MGIRDNFINALANVMRVESPLAKAAAATPPQPPTDAGIPSEWQLATYAPGLPIRPAISQTESEVPREIDYPISVNASLTPRTGYGLMPFSMLKDTYENVFEVRLPISTLLRELTVFRPRLIDDDGNEIDGHPFQWLTEAPDRSTPFDVWLTRYLKSTEIFDAGAFYVQQAHGVVDALHYIDGSTLFVMVDDKGRIPRPNDVSQDEAVRKRYIQKAQEWVRKGKPLPTKTPAFAQVIKGTPFGWYSQDEIWYKPRSQRFDSPYGETPIEQAWAWILIAANITGFELAHYREGNMPEGLLVAPPNWTLERVMAFETAMNARMSSGAAERNRIRVVPNGFTYSETKKPDFPQVLYERARDNISLLFGVPPSEYGSVPGEGLGGAGFEEAMQSSLFRMGIFPLKQYIDGTFNGVLKRAGVNDVKFDLAFPDDEIDPEQRNRTTLELFSAGLLTVNQALGRLGIDKVKDGDIHLIINGGTVTVLDDYLKPEGKRPADLMRQQMEQTDKEDEEGGEESPIPAKTNEAEEMKEPATDEDIETAKKVLAARSPNFAGRKIFDLAENNSVKVHDTLDKAAGHGGRKGLRGGSGPKVVNHSGIMIALDMPDGVARQLLTLAQPYLPEGAEPLPVPEMHITLAYVEQTLYTQDELVRLVRQFSTTHAPLSGTVNGVAKFNAETGGKVPLVALFDCPELPQFRNDLVTLLDSVGVEVSKEHGFIPHITLAYLPKGQEHAHIDMPAFPVSFKELVVAYEGSWHYVSLTGKKNVARLAVPEFVKYCGVREEDDEYYGATVVRDDMFGLAKDFGAEVVTIAHEGQQFVPALWLPEGAESENVRYRTGGPQYVREEAAYLLDRSLDLHLVPVAYVTEVDGEYGAAVQMTDSPMPARKAADYEPSWVERAAVLDYVMRHTARDEDAYFTHPEEPLRMVLHKNGSTFPADAIEAYSPFVKAMAGKPLSNATLNALRVCAADTATWKDIYELVGQTAGEAAYAQVTKLLEKKAIDVTED